MKKNISPNKKSHFLTVVTIIALVNVGLIAYFDPRSLVYQKEIGNTEFGTPYPPTNLTATANSTSQITLTWQPGPIGEFYEPTAFIIYRTIGNNTDFSNAAPYDSAPSYAVSYVDTNLTPGTVYNYKVAARNGTLESSNSNLASAITFSPVPGQPTGVVATATAHNQVQLSWDQVQNATLYHIYRRQNEPAFAEIGTTPSPGFNDNSVSPSLTYAYYIVAENSGGSGPSSAVVSAVTPAAPAQPSNPLPAADTIAPIVSNVVVQKDIISAQISWTTNEVSGGFIVYGKTQNYGMSQSYGFNTAHQISLVNLEQNTEYYFKIIATDASQNSSEYSGVFTTLPASVPLAPPSNFYSSTSTGRIMLSWKNPNDARFRGVKILRKVGATSVNAFDGEMVGDTTAEMFEDLSALYGVDYVYTAYSYGSGVEISSGVVARARLSFLGALPDNTPSSTSPTSSIVTTRCDAQKPDCKSSACASLAVCKNSSLNTSSTVSAFPLSSVSFLTAQRRLEISPSEGVVQGLSERLVVVSIPRSKFTRIPQTIVLTRGSLKIPLQYFPARGRYEAELSFATEPMSEPASIVVNYTRAESAQTDFKLETVSNGRATIKGKSDSRVQVTLLSADGKKVSAPNEEPNPSQSGAFGWMVPNGKYYLRIETEGFTTTTSAFEVKNNIVNTVIDIAPTTAAPPVLPQYQSDYVTEVFVRDVATPITSLLAVLGLLMQVSLFDILALLRLLFLQPILLIGKRERSSWGQVYNSLNKLPVDLATVRLISADSGQILQTRVTGRSGRYYFKVGPGNYRLEVVKDHLMFPSNLLLKTKNDGRKTDLYHGGTFAIREEYPLISLTIPVDPKVEEKTLSRLWWEKAGRVVQVVLSFFGVGATVYSLVRSPGEWQLWALLALHIAILLIFIRLAIPRRPEGWGVLRDADSQHPLSNAVAKLYNTQYNRLVDYELTDRHGRYYFLAGDSTYQVRFEKQEYKVLNTIEIDVRGKEEENIAVNARLERLDRT